MKPSTKSEMRIRKAKKHFKEHYGETARRLDFVQMLNKEEAIFKVTGDTKVSYMVFHENDLMTFADSLDYLVDVDDKKGGIK